MACFASPWPAAGPHSSHGDRGSQSRGLGIQSTLGAWVFAVSDNTPGHSCWDNARFLRTLHCRGAGDVRWWIRALARRDPVFALGASNCARSTGWQKARHGCCQQGTPASCGR